MKPKPFNVSEFNRALGTGRWIAYDTLEAALEAIHAKAARSRKFMEWEVFDESGINAIPHKAIAKVYGQH
jgi:hypothetical protein